MQKTQDISRLCSSCNEFYASSSTNYLCSTCFKKNTTTKIQQKDQISKPQTKEKSQIPNKQQPKVEQPDPSRCFKCTKKVGLLGINCKCGFIFCNKHRMPEEHEWKQQLSKKVESVAPRKLSEI